VCPWWVIVEGLMMKKTDPQEAGFTLTEMLVALAVASTLIVSVGQLLSVTARAYHRVTQSVETLREYRSLDRFVSLLEAADFERVEHAPSQLDLSRGAQSTLTVTVSPDATTNLSLTHNGVALERRYDSFPANEWAGSSHALTLTPLGGGRPLVTLPLLREAPFDCRYDSVAKRCR
jgi:prepilin-type N-terminal cleavage/methylation domain-containing protein